MAARGVAVGRKRYMPAGEVRPLYSDAWVEDRRALIEAKELPWVAHSGNGDHLGVN
jgi:hypothetical protein